MTLNGFNRGLETDWLCHPLPQSLVKNRKHVVDHIGCQPGIYANKECIGRDQIGISQAADNTMSDVLVSRMLLKGCRKIDYASLSWRLPALSQCQRD